MIVVNEHVIVLYSFVNAGDAIVRRPMFQLTTILHNESQMSTDQGLVVIDSVPDYSREHIVWSLLY